MKLGCRVSLGGRFTNALIVVAVVLAISPAAAQPSLTLEQAQRLAVERSRMIVAQDAAATASREMAVAAGQLPDPVATIGVNNLPINGQDAWSFTSDFMTMRSVGVMQEFTRSQKREARAQRFEREADRSTAERAVTIANIQRDAALAWIDRYYAEAQANVVKEQIGQTRLEVDAADAAYRAGRGSLADIIGARSAIVSLDDRQSELARRARAARVALARWVGEAADAPLAGKPEIATIRLDPRTLDTDIVHHPDLVVLAKREEVAAAEVKIAQASKQADWSVSLMYSQRGPAYSNMISLNASVPLQWDQANRQDREVAAKLAMLDQVRAEREDMVRAHTAEVRAMVVAWQDDRERLTRFDRELVPLARERTEATVASYRGAKATLADVLQARRTEIDVRLQALQLEAELARTWAQLNFLVPLDHASRSPR
jgi:outer membrane protein TolC